MKIIVYPIRSVMDNGLDLSSMSQRFLKELEVMFGEPFAVSSSLEDLRNADLSLILVQSGGSEGAFKKNVYPYFEGPYYLLTYGASNSLAASLEILTFIHQESKKGEVLHGNNDYIVSRMRTILQNKEALKPGAPARLGILGEPSDWLIGSHVDPLKAKEVFNVELVTIDEREILKTVARHKENCDPSLFKARFDKKELDRAYAIYEALQEIVKKHGLSGYTLRCFDIIAKCHMSACLALAYANEKDVIASCEGDVPAMITAYAIMKVLKVHAFQANPQWIDPVQNTIELAHCTFPLDMAEQYCFDTHFESGEGIAIHGQLREGPCTILKVSSDLSEFYVSDGMITENEYRKDRCRTQIKVHLNDPVSYFLRSSLGNHHQVIYGHHKKEMKEYFESLGLREVVG